MNKLKDKTSEQTPSSRSQTNIYDLIIRLVSLRTLTGIAVLVCVFRVDTVDLPEIVKIITGTPICVILFAVNLLLIGIVSLLLYILYRYKRNSALKGK